MALREAIGKICIALFFALCGLMIGLGVSGEYHRGSAIEAGVAEYYLDENHRRQFRFTPCGEVEE